MSLKCLPTTVKNVPLNNNNNINITNSFCRHTCAVSVEYCVLRSKKKTILKKRLFATSGINYVRYQHMLKRECYKLF